MDRAGDLAQLGAALRARREALGLTREALSTRIGVTPTYIFMIESSTPRKGRALSRIRRATLLRWVSALEMDQPAINRLLGLAGYAPIETTPVDTRKSSLPVAGEGQVLDAVVPDRSRQRDRLVQLLDDVLDRASASEEDWQEAVGLLTTLLTVAKQEVRRRTGE